MIEVEWSLADDYFLRGFAYHDGTIEEFRYGSVLEGCSKRRDLLLDVANLQNETVHLRFSGVEVLRVTELWEGSIVNTISAARLSDAAVTHLPVQEFWRSLQSNEAGIRNMVSRFGGHLVVVVTGSYGCEFSLLCEGLRVSKTPLPSPT